MPQRSLCALTLAAVLVSSAQAADEEGEIRKKVDRAVAKVYPALVQVLVVTAEYRDGREQKFQSAGSGAIISPEGHVVTNHHVAGKAKQIRCRLSNREELPATLVGTDALADIAIIKLDLTESKDKKFKLPVARFGDSDKLKAGTRVLAMGCPVALSQSMTMGVVSNMEMTIPKFFWPFTFKLEGEETGTLVKWIGHDAQIFPGNSGGPLVNLDGEIVGINEISLGLGGAIPSNLARLVSEQLVQYGKPVRSWTGFRCQPLLKDHPGQQGALISEVLKDSPAARAGLQPGDIILSYDGQPVTVRYAEQLPDFNRRVFFTKVGVGVPLEILRGDKKFNTEVVTTLAEPARGEERELRDWGITARQITDPTARELRRSGKDGVYVWSIRPGGAANEAKPSIGSEDVIIAVNGTPVRDLAHLEELTAAIVKGKREAVPALVAFERRNERVLTVVKLGPSKESDRAVEPTKPWLPVTYQVFSGDLAEALKLKAVKGVIITQVYPKSPAEAAGLKTGDILTHLDGNAIEASQPEDIKVLEQMIRRYKPGVEAEFTVRREPKYEPQKISLKLPERPKATGEMKNYKDKAFDLEVRDLSYLDRVRERWEETQGGALVTSVEPGGWAALACLGVNDLITAVDGVAIANVAAFEQRMKKVVESRPRRVIFFILRGIHTVFLELEPAWETRKEEASSDK